MIAQIRAELAKPTAAKILNNTPLPRVSISGFPIIAPRAAKIFRIRLFIATADELLPGTASMRYVVVVAKVIIIPSPKRKVPISGMTTKRPFSIVQPYISIPRGYMIAPTHVLIPKRPSGSN